MKKTTFITRLIEFNIIPIVLNFPLLLLITPNTNPPTFSKTNINKKSVIVTTEIISKIILIKLNKFDRYDFLFCAFYLYAINFGPSSEWPT